MNRPATASQSLGGHQRKMLLAFRICARPIFSPKKERTFFFGVLPSMLRAGGGTNADEVLAKQFFGVRKCGTLSQDLLRRYSVQKVYSFCKKRICQNFGSFVFELCRKWKRRGLGRNFPFAPLFVLGEFGADKKYKIQVQYCASSILTFCV